jgi:hypothetical protein
MEKDVALVEQWFDVLEGQPDEADTYCWYPAPEGDPTAAAHQVLRNITEVLVPHLTWRELVNLLGAHKREKFAADALWLQLCMHKYRSAMRGGALIEEWFNALGDFRKWMASRNMDVSEFWQRAYAHMSLAVRVTVFSCIDEVLRIRDQMGGGTYSFPILAAYASDMSVPLSTFVESTVLDDNPSGDFILRIDVRRPPTDHGWWDRLRSLEMGDAFVYNFRGEGEAITFRRVPNDIPHDSSIARDMIRLVPTMFDSRLLNILSWDDGFLPNGLRGTRLRLAYNLPHPGIEGYRVVTWLANPAFTGGISKLAAAFLPLPPNTRVTLYQSRLSAFVPQDSRTEYPVLHPGITVFQSRVAPSDAVNFPPLRFASAFVALSLSHPCTVLVQNLTRHPEYTGPAVIHEYETLRDVPLKTRAGTPAAFQMRDWTNYDELIAFVLKTDRAADYVRLDRSYPIKKETIARSSILRVMEGNDAAEHSTPGRMETLPAPWPITRSSLLSPLSAAVMGEGPSFDLDYLHMRQFFDKKGTEFGRDAMTLLAAALGSEYQVKPSDDHTGPHTLQRHAIYCYAPGAKHMFASPVQYYDKAERREMDDCVGFLLFFTGTWHYANALRSKYPVIEHHVEIVGCAARTRRGRPRAPLLPPSRRISPPSAWCACGSRARARSAP